MGVEEWAALGESLKNCISLVEILGFEWSKSVLANGVTCLDLNKRDISDLESTIISALLPRIASTLNVLLLGWDT